MDEVLNKNIKNTGVGIVLAIILTFLSYLVADWAGWIDLAKTDFLIAFAVFTSYLCTWLCVHQTRWNYPVGVVTTAAYSLVFWNYELYALSIFNAYLVFSLAYGWWRWGKDENTRPVTLISWPWHLGYVALAGLIYGILWIVHTIIGQDMAWYDVILAVASGVAQFLLDNKKMESWYVWVVVNIISILLFFGFITDDPNAYQPIVGFQYIFFLLNAFYGLYEWNKSYQNENEPDNFEESLKEIVFPDYPRTPRQTAVFD